MTRELPKLATSLTLLMALLGPPLLFVMLPRWLFGRNPTLTIQIILEALFLGLAALVIWVVVRLERMPLDSIGLRWPSWSTLATAGLLWIILQFLPLITQPLVSILGTEGFQAGLDDLVRRPIWFVVIGGLAAGIVEETLYRGYAIERLGTLTGHRWMGGTISAIIFGIAHIPTWGAGFALGVDFPFGVVMTVFYMWRRDLIANILVHSGGGVVAMLTVVK